jgi:glycerol-3-phosphate cytidylyltransferase
MIIGFTSGVFDLFHVGHLNLLRKARSKCDKLIVAVCTDDLCFQLKGKYPIIPFENRIEILKNLKCVDEVVSEVVDDKLFMREIIKFDVFFKGDDWKGTPKWNKLVKDFRKVGVKVVFLPYTKGVNSSMLRSCLK